MSPGAEEGAPLDLDLGSAGEARAAAAWNRFRRRCGRGEPSPGADVEGVSPVLAQMWAG